MNCDPIAPYYASIEFAVFGRALERCRFQFLPRLTRARRALVLGDGDGRFLQRLLEACPDLHADYVDCSAGMLAKAKRAVDADRVTFHCIDVLSGPLPTADFDLVASHFLLDCFNGQQQSRLIERIASATPRARWVVSEFRVPATWLAGPAKALIAVMYRFFALATGLKTKSLSDHRPKLLDAGFRLVATESHAGGFVVSELWTRDTVE